MTRACPCDHPLPACACALGLSGPELFEASRLISSRAGWPIAYDPAEAARLTGLISAGVLTLEGLTPRAADPPGRATERLSRAARSCPDRGPSLPVSLQPDCGCSELYACSAGKGRVPGRVTTRDCFACRGAWLETGPPRVGFACPVLHTAGAEVWQLTLAKALAGRYELAGFAVEQDAAHAGLVGSSRVYAPVEFGRDAARRLAARCDVLVSWAVDLPSAFSGLPSRPASVVVNHAPPESPWGRHVFGWAHLVDLYVAVSSLALAGMPAEVRPKSVVVENAADPGRLAPNHTRAETHARWGVPPGSKVALFLGRFSREKDPVALARAAAHLPAPWHAVLVGHGPCEARLRHAAAAAPNAHVLPHEPTPGDALAAADVVVCPSHYESFGLTVAEALAAGVPVVSTPVGVAELAPGVNDVVPHGCAPAALARAVTLASAKPGSRELALSRWGFDRFAREWQGAVESAIATRAEAGR